MQASLFLAAFDPLHEVPRVCALCGTKAPVFNYEFRTYGEGGSLSEDRGFCCANCASNLVKQLERNEARVWVQAKTAVKAEDADVNAVHAQRLAAFPRRN